MLLSVTCTPYGDFLPWVSYFVFSAATAVESKVLYIKDVKPLFFFISTVMYRYYKKWWVLILVRLFYFVDLLLFFLAWTEYLYKWHAGVVRIMRMPEYKYLVLPKPIPSLTLSIL